MKVSSSIRKINFLSCLLAIGLFSSCEKFTETDPPKTQLEANKIFSNDQAVVSAMSGLYSYLSLSAVNFINGGITLYTALSADELYLPVSNTNADLFASNSLIPTHSPLYSALWAPAYQYLYRANAVIEGLTKSTTLSDSVKNQLMGEAKTIRALSDFYLINLFGDIPLVNTTDYETNSHLGRQPVQDVYQQIISDLGEARQLLTPVYPSVNRGRPNKWTATALLARVYLYLGDWQKAESLSTEIIDSGLYSLVTSSLNNVFLPASTETIWQLLRDNNNTSDGATFIPSSTTVKPTYAVRPQLLNAFEPGDKRKTNWLAKNTIGTEDLYYPNKYKSRLTTPITEYLVIFRLAEQYLIRAEARAQLDNVNGSKNDLNMVRSRAGLAVTAASDKASLLTAIEQERKVEFFAEMGFRWLDLKRTNRADAVLQPLKAPNWENTDKLYPIPQREMDVNPFLIQNPGY